MKIPKIFSLSVDTVNALNARAQIAGCTYSALAELCIRLTLKSLSDEKLIAWASTSRTKPEPVVSTRMPASERKILNVMHHAEFKPASVLRSFTGQGEAIFWRALRSLEAKGLVEADPAFADAARDGNGYPVHSCWRSKA